MGVAIKLWSLPLPPSVRIIDSQCPPYQALQLFLQDSNDNWYGKKKLWVAAVMRTISRRRAEGNLLELIYRKPPSPEPEREISSHPEPPKLPKGSVAKELVQEEVTAWDPSVKPELLLEFPAEEPVEDEVVDVPGKADLKKSKKSLKPKAQQNYKKWQSAGTSRSDV